MGYVYPSSVCVLKECTGMQPLGRHFVTRLKGGSTLGPALVLLDVVAERLTRVQWEPCAHPGRLIAGLLMTAKRWKQLLFVSRRMDAKYLADFFFCWGSVDSLTLCKLKVYSVLT